MPRTLTQEFSDRLAKLLIIMRVPKEICLDILTAIETPEELVSFLDKLSGKLYDMPPEEVYEAALETVAETT